MTLEQKRARYRMIKQAQKKIDTEKAARYAMLKAKWEAVL